VVGKSTSREIALEELNKRGHHVFTAGSADQESFASLSEWGGSLFTRALLDGLRGEADYSIRGKAPDGVVSLTELKTYVRERIKVEREKRRGRIRQWPQESDLLSGASRGEFYFFTPEKRRMAAAAPPSAATGPVQGKGAGAPGLDPETAACWASLMKATRPIFGSFCAVFRTAAMPV
jgi:uncharacterized caspase-like protein